MNQTITLTLTIPEINTILAALGQMPYAQVVEMLAKVKTQAEEQVNAPKE